MKLSLRCLIVAVVPRRASLGIQSKFCYIRPLTTLAARAWQNLESAAWTLNCTNLIQINSRHILLKIHQRKIKLYHQLLKSNLPKWINYYQNSSWQFYFIYFWESRKNELTQEQYTLSRLPKFTNFLGRV